MQRSRFRKAMIWSAVPVLIAATGPAAHAFTLPVFNKDIVPIGLSVTIQSKEVKPKVGPASLNASFKLDTPFTSQDFAEDLCEAASDAVLIIGTAPSHSCKTGETTSEPITIDLGAVHSTACASFAYTASNLAADWTISAYVPTAGGNNQSVSCVNGNCTTSSGGTSIVTSDGQTTVVQSEALGSGDPTPTDQLSFTATTKTPDVILVPSSKVDVFILYTADDDEDDTGSNAAYEGACVTLNSTSVINQTQIINGKTVTTKVFSAR